MFFNFFYVYHDYLWDQAKNNIVKFRLLLIEILTLDVS